MDKREKQLYNVSFVAIVGNAFLAISKIAVGIISGSFAVIGDGIDSATDIATSFITLITARIIAKPPDIKYPYGYKKADSIAAKLLSFIIFFAGTQLAISTFRRFFENSSTEVPSILAIYITLVSIFGKLGLSIYLQRAGKTLKSNMIIANAKNMQNDILTSSSVLAGLVFTHILQMPIIDLITAFAISIWIMKSGYEIFMHSSSELMDGNENPALYKEVFDIVEGISGVNNPHRARIRKIGNLFNITIDIEVDGKMTVEKAHELAHSVEQILHNKMNNIHDVIVHVEPIGEKDLHTHERFGVSKSDFET